MVCWHVWPVPKRYMHAGMTWSTLVSNCYLLVSTKSSSSFNHRRPAGKPLGVNRLLSSSSCLQNRFLCIGALAVSTLPFSFICTIFPSMTMASAETAWLYQHGHLNLNSQLVSFGVLMRNHCEESVLCSPEMPASLSFFLGDCALPAWGKLPCQAQTSTWSRWMLDTLWYCCTTWLSAHVIWLDNTLKQ